MKWNGLKEAVALAICACTLAGTAANAQLVVRGSSTNAVQASLSTSSGYAMGSDRMSSDDTSVDLSRGSLVINRFGVRDGRIVAYGRLVPTGSVGGLSVGASTGAAIPSSVSLMSSPAEPAGGYGSDPMLGAGYRVSLSSSSLLPRSSASSSVSLGSATSSGSSIGASSSFDASRLGGWTGIGTGYGESGVDSRSNMVNDDDDAIVSMNLGRPYDDVSYMEDITWQGESSDFEASLYEDGDIDLQMGPTSGNDRTLIDLEMGATSANDRTALVDVNLRDDDRPLVQLGGSQRLYSSEEAERALAVMSSSEDIAIPVTIVGASCDAVSLSFGGSEPVVVTSASGSDSDRLQSTLCAVADANSTYSTEGGNTMLLKHLNRLVSRSR
jgi:hypothetical protein